MSAILRAVCFSLSVVILAGCDLIPRKVLYSDPQVQELLRAVERAAPYRYGFSIISEDAEFRVEKSSGVYDRMLHVDGSARRTIAFERREDGFEWTGE